jgi:16S rRNA U516 pseudouridylate synthase RsuA-like enzyme
MFEAIGKNVMLLKRVSIGQLKLTGLDRGQIRPLTEREVEYLKGM